MTEKDSKETKDGHKADRCLTKKAPPFIYHIWLMTSDGSLSKVGDFKIGLDTAIGGMNGNVFHPVVVPDPDNKKKKNVYWEKIPCGRWITGGMGTTLVIDKGAHRGVYTGMMTSLVPVNFSYFYYRQEWHGYKYSLEDFTYTPEAQISMMRVENVPSELF